MIVKHNYFNFLNKCLKQILIFKGLKLLSVLNWDLAATATTQLNLIVSLQRTILNEWNSAPLWL